MRVPSLGRGSSGAIQLPGGVRKVSESKGLIGNRIPSVQHVKTGGGTGSVPEPRVSTGSTSQSGTGSRDASPSPSSSSSPVSAFTPTPTPAASQVPKVTAAPPRDPSSSDDLGNSLENTHLAPATDGHEEEPFPSGAETPRSTIVEPSETSPSIPTSSEDGISLRNLSRVTSVTSLSPSIPLSEATTAGSLTVEAESEREGAEGDREMLHDVSGVSTPTETPKVARKELPEQGGEEEVDVTPHKHGLLNDDEDIDDLVERVKKTGLVEEEESNRGGNADGEDDKTPAASMVIDQSNSDLQSIDHTPHVEKRELIEPEDLKEHPIDIEESELVKPVLALHPVEGNPDPAAPAIEAVPEITPSSPSQLSPTTNPSSALPNKDPETGSTGPVTPTSVETPDEASTPTEDTDAVRVQGGIAADEEDVKTPLATTEDQPEFIVESTSQVLINPGEEEEVDVPKVEEMEDQVKTIPTLSQAPQTAVASESTETKETPVLKQVQVGPIVIEDVSVAKGDAAGDLTPTAEDEALLQQLEEMNNAHTTLPMSFPTPPSRTPTGTDSTTATAAENLQDDSGRSSPVNPNIVNSFPSVPIDDVDSPEGKVHVEVSLSPARQQGAETSQIQGGAGAGKGNRKKNRKNKSQKSQSRTSLYESDEEDRETGGGWAKVSIQKERY